MTSTSPRPVALPLGPPASARIALLFACTLACGDVQEPADGPDGAIAADAGAEPAAPDAEPPPDAGDGEVPLAPFDGDSLQSPAEEVFLSVTGTRSFTYVDEISEPEGDREDWVAFAFPNGSNPARQVELRLTCTFTGDADPIVRATLFEDGVSLLQGTACGDGLETFTVDDTRVQSVQITTISADAPLHVAYALEVVGFD